MRRSRCTRNILLLPFLFPPTLAVSLASFQSISSSNPACLNAYNSEIRSCTDADFINGAACSEGCMKSLQDVQKVVANACQGIRGPSDSLLGQLLKGSMVVTLCPNYKRTTETSPTQTSSASRGPGRPTSEKKDTTNASPTSIVQTESRPPLPSTPSTSQAPPPQSSPPPAALPPPSTTSTTLASSTSSSTAPSSSANSSTSSTTRSSTNSSSSTSASETPSPSSSSASSTAIPTESSASPTAAPSGPSTSILVSGTSVLNGQSPGPTGSESTSSSTAGPAPGQGVDDGTPFGVSSLGSRELDPATMVKALVVVSMAMAWGW